MISDDIKERLYLEAVVAEQTGTLTVEQLKIIYREKWFKLFVPKEYDGLELSLPDGLRIEEALAAIDGSLGWTVTLCSGATMFIGYLEQDISKIIFKDKKVCFGGSGRPSGIATVNSSGYEVNGFWHYATGAPHNTVFTANCVIEQDGVVLKHADGSPVIQSFFFTRDEVTILDDWNTMGLKATAGHSFEVRNLQLADNRSFIIDSNHATLPHPVYHYPFLQFAEATIAVNTLGMAQHFLEECKCIFNKKNNNSKSPLLREKLHNAIHELGLARQQFYATAEASWEAFTHHTTEEGPTLQEVSKISREMVRTARALVSELYPFCGMIAADPASTINRIWRDIYTGSQHSLLNFPAE